MAPPPVRAGWTNGRAGGHHPWEGGRGSLRCGYGRVRGVAFISSPFRALDPDIFSSLFMYKVYIMNYTGHKKETGKKTRWRALALIGPFSQ